MTIDDMSASGQPRHRRVEQRRLFNRDVLSQLIMYGVNGLFTAVVYSLVVWTLIHLSHGTFALDVVVAYACAVLCNYFGARRIFQPTTSLRGHMPRYVTVVLGAFATTTLLAWLIHKAGAPDLIGAYLPVALTAVPTFIVLRVWVFTSPPPAD